MFNAIVVEMDGTEVDNYWGACPDCHRTDGYINIGREHWFYCMEHKSCWYIGWNLFSSWRDQTEEEQRRIFDELDFESFDVIEPCHYGEWNIDSGQWINTGRWSGGRKKGNFVDYIAQRRKESEELEDELRSQRVREGESSEESVTECYSSVPNATAASPAFSEDQAATPAEYNAFVSQRASRLVRDKLPEGGMKEKEATNLMKSYLLKRSGKKNLREISAPVFERLLKLLEDATPEQAVMIVRLQ